MISGIGGGSSQVLASQVTASQAVAVEPQQLESGGSGALPEAPSPFDIALQIQDVQVDNIKRALDAQTLVLDLLV